MTKQSKLDKFLSSIFSTHIDPENSEVLDNKKDTENNFDKIIQLVTDEENDTSLNSLNKNELVSLIKDVHEGYEDLYKRYDHLTENLKKKFHRKEHHGWFSYHSSSDSDSSDSASEVSSKNQSEKNLKGELEISLEKCKKLEQQLVAVNKQNYEFQTDVNSLLVKMSEYETTEAKLEDVKAAKVMLEKELQSLINSTELLQNENRDLKEQLSASLKGQEELNQRIHTIEEQNKALSSDNSKALSKLHEAVKFAEGHKIEIQQMKDEMLAVDSNNTILKKELEEKNQEVTSLNHLLDNKNKETEALRSENFESRSKIEELEKSLVDQRDEFTSNMKLASDDFSSKISQVLLDNESMKGDLQAAGEKSSELSKALAELENTNEVLKSDILRSSFRMQDMENMINDMKLSSEMLKDENFKLANQRDEAMTNMKLADDEFSSKLTKLLTGNESLKLDLEAAARKSDELNKALAEMQEENKDLKSDLMKSSSQMQEMDGLVNNLKLSSERLKNENLDLLRKMQELEKSFADHKNEATRSIELANDEFSSKVANLMTENERLKLDLETATSKSYETSQILAEVQEENGALKSDLLSSSSQMQDMEKTVSGLKMSSELLKDENSKLLSKIKELEKSLTDIKDEATLSLKLANDEFSYKIAKLLSENENLKLDLQAASRNSSELSKNLAEAQEQNEALKSDILRSSHQMQSIENAVNDLKMSSEILENEKSNLLIVIDDLNQQLKDKEEKEKTLESKLVEAVKITREEREKANKFSLELEEVRNENAEVNETMRLKFEATVQELIKLKQVLETVTNEKCLLASENQELMSRLGLANTEVETYKAQVKQLEMDVSRLHTKIQDLDLELDSTKHQLAQINKELGSTAEQVEKLSLENSRLMSELESANVLCKDLENELGHLKDENLTLNGIKDQLQESEKIICDLRSEIQQLTGVNAQLHVNVDDLSNELKTVIHQVSKLNKQLEFSREEKSELIKKLEQVETDIITQENNLEVLSKDNSTLQQNNNDLHDRKSDLEEELQTKSVELSSLQKNFEEAQSEAMGKIQAFVLQVNDLQAGISLLQREKSELERQMKKIGDIFLENQDLMTKLEDGIAIKISEQEQKLEIQKNKSDDFLKDLRKLKEQFQVTREKLDIAITDGEKQCKQINKLSEIQKELTEKLKLSETEKADSSKEIGRLQSLVEAGEVQLCLANQLLHITKGENKEKEEMLQERIRELQVTIQKVSGSLDLLQKELSRIKVVIESRISGMWPEFDKIESFFEKKHSQIESGLSMCIKEMEILKAKSREQIYQKQKINEEIHKLTSTLKIFEETFSVVKSEAEDLRSQLVKKKTEAEKLTGRASESDKRLQQMDMMMKEQAEEILIRNEEKREAIRQLCLLIDYYRDKCSKLYEYILATQKGNRR